MYSNNIVSYFKIDNVKSYVKEDVDEEVDDGGALDENKDVDEEHNDANMHGRRCGLRLGTPTTLQV